MQEPIIDEAHVEEDLCLLIGLLAAHNEPETSDQTARDLATHSQSEGREHPSPANPAAPNPAAQAMAAYLREHASTTVRLEEVAAAAGLDKYRAPAVVHRRLRAHTHALPCLAAGGGRPGGARRRG